jgi:hypothetical protein
MRKRRRRDEWEPAEAEPRSHGRCGCLECRPLKLPAGKPTIHIRTPPIYYSGSGLSAEKPHE